MRKGRPRMKASVQSHTRIDEKIEFAQLSFNRQLTCLVHVRVGQRHATLAAKHGELRFWRTDDACNRQTVRSASDLHLGGDSRLEEKKRS